VSSPALTLTPGQNFEKEVVTWTDSLYSQVVEDREKEAEARDCQKILDFLDGKQWPSKARHGRQRPVINKFHRHFFEAIGLLSDLALDFQIKLYDKQNDFSEFEFLLNQLSVHWAQRQYFEDRLYDIIMYGLVNSGPYKLQWNSALNGGLGDMELVSIAPWNFALVGAGNGQVQDAEAVIYHRPVTIEYLFRKYGKVATRVKADSTYSGNDSFGGTSESLRPSHISKETWSRIGENLKKILVGNQQQSASSHFPITMLKEYWLKDASVNETSESVIVGPNKNGQPLYNWCYRVEPGEPLYPRGRVILTAGGCVLEDAPNPYWHAQFPFGIFRPYRVPWRLSGVSAVKPWMQMSTIMNKIYGGCST
jgi:hypothetical protein